MTVSADDIYLQRCQEAAVATRKLADLRAFFASDEYDPSASSALDGLELDACRLMSEFLVNPFTPVDWTGLLNNLEQLRLEAIEVYNADVLDLPVIDALVAVCLDEPIAPEVRMEIDDPSIVDTREVHAEPYGKVRNHSRRHVSDRLSQLLGEPTFNRRICRGAEEAAVATIAGYKTLKQCRGASDIRARARNAADERAGRGRQRARAGPSDQRAVAHLRADHIADGRGGWHGRRRLGGCRRADAALVAS